MKLKPITLALIFVALGLGGFVYFYEIRGVPQRETAKTQAQQLFSFKEDQIQAFTIKSSQRTLAFEKAKQQNARTSGDSQWLMRVSEPAKGKAPSPQVASPLPASDASVAYLLNLLATAKSDRTLNVPATQRAEFGLDQPQATIDVKLNNQKTHQLILGKTDFNRSFLYAQADPPANPTQNIAVALVSPDFENAINRSLAEWKAPGEKANPKPEPAASADPKK